LLLWIYFVYRCVLVYIHGPSDFWVFRQLASIYIILFHCTQGCNLNISDNLSTSTWVHCSSAALRHQFRVLTFHPCVLQPRYSSHGQMKYDWLYSISVSSPSSEEGQAKCWCYYTGRFDGY
jgi:hypothetical protein